MRHPNLRSPTRVLSLLVLLTVFGSAQARGQVCRAADDSSYAMIEMVKSFALATDSSWVAARDARGIPAASSANTVVLITRENTCKSANTAYQSVATGARQTLTGRVYVVQVGTSYVVWDPGYRYDIASPADIYMVFDSRWAKKSIF